MVRVLAVNNYPSPERFEKLRRALVAGGAEVSTITWQESSARKFNSYDGVALSGSPDMLSKAAVQLKYAGEIEAIRDAEVPVLGVCYGHQLMAAAFGGGVVPDNHHVLAFVETEAVKENPLFSGLEKPVMLLESRYEVVDPLPTGFDLLARSSTSKIAAMKHRKLPLYGVQSHPERYSAAHPGGSALVRNFVGTLR